VWQGPTAEILTCNALEWQAAEGGGRIIESDRTISVNNPATIRSWQRAKHWIGSPPGVAFRERDSLHVFDSGKAAFNRAWLEGTITRRGPFQFYWPDPAVEVGFTSMPSGFGTLEVPAWQFPSIRTIVRKRLRSFDSWSARKSNRTRTGNAFLTLSSKSIISHQPGTCVVILSDRLSPKDDFRVPSRMHANIFVQTPLYEYAE